MNSDGNTSFYFRKINDRLVQENLYDIILQRIFDYNFFKHKRAHYFFLFCYTPSLY